MVWLPWAGCVAGCHGNRRTPLSNAVSRRDPRQPQTSSRDSREDVLSETLEVGIGVLITATTFITHLPLVPHICQWIGSALIQIMACRLFGAKPLSKPELDYYQLDPMNKLQWSFSQKSNFFIQGNSFENVVCEIAAILSRGTWVRQYHRILLIVLCTPPNNVHRPSLRRGHMTAGFSSQRHKNGERVLLLQISP